MENVIIIGGGPAGYTAGIYTARANLKPLIIEGAEYGGQLMTTSVIENYPGFPEGIQGPDLMANMRKQAERFGAKLISENVTKVDFSKKPLKVFVGDKAYEGKTVIIATGAAHRHMGFPDEKKWNNKGISYCATCDGYFYQNKEVAVAGGGDSAMEEALSLTKYAKKVTVIHRRDCLRASKYMQQRAFDNPKIEFLWDSIVEGVEGKDKFEGLKIKNVKTEKTSVFKCDGLFVAIGLDPQTSMFDGQLKMVNKYIFTEPDLTKTSVEGVFACGDVMDWVFRQATTSVGNGCRAAIEVERYIQSKEPGKKDKTKVC